jgi:hypothetical protein
MNKPYDRPLKGNRTQCQGCYEYFNSLSAFEWHRVGTFMPNTRRCLKPEEMTELGMSLNQAGFWITEKRQILASATSEGAANSSNG